jgi:stearoyl-CoA desaturase (delta-9 desaturase)
MSHSTRDMRGHVALLPFATVHVLAVTLPFVVGVSWQALALCAVSYAVRMFGISAGYHRYFAHRSFKTSRPFQLVLALLGATAMQKGPLWWASHHRHHHRYSDTERDVHSPTRRGFWWSHMGWILSNDYVATDSARVKDLGKDPEVRWVDRYATWPGLIVLGAMYFTLGAQMAVWGGLVSTMLLWHATFTINSVSHVFGRRDFATADTSRNSLPLALVTLGEGWHNNHHHHQASANFGFAARELDLSFGVLRVLERLGVIWDVKRAPGDVLAARLAG